MKVAKNQSGVMELGGNMPGDLETRFAEVEERKAVSAGELSNEEFELALPSGATREARQQARSELQTEKSLEEK